MEYDSVRQVYFSATGTTKKIIQRIAGGFPGEKTVCDLLKKPMDQDLSCAANDLVIVGMPVYSGRISAVPMKSLQHFKGDGTAALAVVVYGNRDYDDALLELKDTLEHNGFAVVAAAAFIGQHAVFPGVAGERPDSADMKRVADFACECAAKLESTAKPAWKPITVKGNFPYREANPVPFTPATDEACIVCGACSSICPVQAISAADPRMEMNDDCIACGACVTVCPQKHRYFRGPEYETTAAAFARKYNRRLEPEIFL